MPVYWPTIPSGTEAYIVDTGKAFLGYVRDDLQGPLALTIYLDEGEAITDAVKIGGFIRPGTVRIFHEAAMAIGLPAVIQFPGGDLWPVVGPESYEEVDHATIQDQER